MRDKRSKPASLREVGLRWRFTARQTDVLRQLLFGASEKRAAANLGLSQHTVHVHVKQIYKRMRVNSRAELMARFLNDVDQKDLVMPER